MDEKYLEMASEQTLAEAEAGIALVKSRIPVQPPDFDGRCKCGEDIPNKRLATGAITCVPCQTVIERKRMLTR